MANKQETKCRTCLAEYKNMISITADYIVHDKLVTIADIIIACTSVQITPNDNFPQYICENCVRDAIAAYTFKRQCEQTDQLLKSQLNEAQTELYKPLEISNYNLNSEEQLTQHECENCLQTFETAANLQEHNCTNPSNIQKKTLRSMRKTSKVEDELVNDSESDNNFEESDTKTSLDEEEYLKVATPASKILTGATEKNTDGLFQCLCCDEYCKTKRELQKHTRKHKSFKCKLCGKSFTIVSNLRRHLRAHGHENNDEFPENTDTKETSPEFKCISCEQIFNKRKLLSEHLKSHKDFSCSMCKSKFTFASNLRKHLRAHNKPKDAIQIWKQPPVDKRTCDICFKVFKYRPSMLKHRKKHNTYGKTCQYCEEVYETSIKLYKHMEEMHQHEKNIVCAQCGKKFFREWNLKMHMIVHTGLRPFMCEICGMSFALQGNLASHRRLHTGIKPYKCETCGKGFTQQAALRSHEAGHSNKRDYVCPDCGKGFSRIGAMKNHRKRHDNSKPFPCYMCEKRFTFSSERKRHMTIHTGEKKFICNICGRAFNRPTNLKVHMQIHTRDYHYRCKYCDKGFIQAHGLKSHLLMHEKKLNVADKLDPAINEKLIARQQQEIGEQIQIIEKDAVLETNQTVLYEVKDDHEDGIIRIVFPATS